MTPRTCFERGLKRYGSWITITRGDSVIRAKAFIQPLRSRARPYLNTRMLARGYFDNGYMIYIGDCRYPFVYGDGAVITHLGTDYTVERSEVFTLGDEAIYVRAVLCPAVYEEGEDDSEDF